MLLLCLIAAAGGPSEREGRPAVRQVFAGEHRWTLTDGTLYRDGRAVLHQVVGEISSRGDRIIAAVRIEEPVFTDLALIDGAASPTLLGLEAWRPDRPALGPDGRWVVFVSGRSGWASLWISPVDRRMPPRQLTNVALERHPGGGLPERFVPPPEGAPRFEAEHIVWSAGGRTWRVRWR